MASDSFANGGIVNTIKDLVNTISVEHSHLQALLLKEEDGYTQLSYGELTEYTTLLGCGLLSLGIRRGDKIGIMAENRKEWHIVYLAVTTIGAVIVPVSILWEQPEIAAVSQNSDMKILFTSAAYLEKTAPLLSTHPSLEQIISFDPHDLLSENINPLKHKDISQFEMKKNISLFETLLEQGRYLLQKDSNAYQSIQISPDEPAEILFVSCKIGVTLSHRALMANVEGIFNSHQLLKTTGKKCMLLIPYSHLYPTVFAVLLSLMARWTVVTAPYARIDRILGLIKETQPNYIVLVPLLLERLYNRLLPRLKKNPGKQLPGFEHLEWIFVAGVKCPEVLLSHFETLGITVLEGYGLSEMAPFITMNTLRGHRPGSVGLPLPNVQVKIDSPDQNGNGMILAKGPNMMSHYYKWNEQRHEMTEAGGIFIDDDGWLHTGDIGRMDDNGFLYITGRARDIIVSRGGSNIYPKEIEARLLKSPYISAVRVVRKWDDSIGEYPFVYIVPAQSLKKNNSTGDPTLSNPQLETEITNLITNEINELAGRMASYKIPKGFGIIDTQTLKTLDKQPVFMFTCDE